MSKRVIVKYSNSELTKLVEDETSCVSVVNSIFNLELFPYHLADISGSIKDLLKDKITTYCKRLKGILLGYKNLTLLTPQGAIFADSCCTHVAVEGDFYVFQPKINSTLTGVVNKVSANHVNCLVHKVFNISVPIPNKEHNEEWIGFIVDVGQEVKLLLTDMHLDARLPYIRASLISSTPMNKNNKIAFNDNKGEESPNKKGKKNTKDKKSSKKNKLQNNSVLGENETENFETPKERKKKHSKKDLGDTSLEKVEQNSLADFVTPVVKKERKSKRISDIQEREEIVDLNSSKKRKSKKHSEKVNDVVESIINKQNKRGSKNNRQEITSEMEFEHDEIKKKKKNFEKVKNVVDSIVHKKNKHHSKEVELEDNKKESEQLNDVVDSIIYKKNKRYSELDSGDDGKKKSEKLTDVVDSLLSKKNKRSSTENINKKNKQTSEVESDNDKREQKRKTATPNVPDIKQEQNDDQKIRKMDESKMEIFITQPPKSMANDEDRRTKKRRSSTHKQVIWDKNQGLNLYDPELDEILKREKKEPVDNCDFDLVKIIALNDGEQISKSKKRKNDSLSEFEEPAAKKSKRKSK